MAGRIRSIKPEILEDERSAALSSDAWRLWVSMWVLADDYGRLRGASEWLRAQVFWCHPKIQVDTLLESLANARVILRYEVEGQRYIEIRNWAKHQKVDHPGKPRIPEPLPVTRETFDNPRENLAKERETLAPDLRSGSPITDLSFGPSDLTFDFLKLYDIYPKKRGKTRGLKLCKSQVRTAADYAALELAVRKYAKDRHGKDQEFSMHFSTFMGCWRDWADPETTAASKAPDAVSDMLKRINGRLNLVDD